jgi:ADP-ribosyl-[dinitrogen reductase] hydrolase
LNEHDRFRGCLLGLAVGDAVGMAVEFKKSGTFPKLTDMTGGGPFGLEAGQWTDDTSMALCLATSLIERQGFDAEDQMRRYCRWVDEGYLSSIGRCFDIGNTVSDALRRFRQTGNPFAGSTESSMAGNGSIMRLAPVPMFYFPDESAAVRYSAESSRTTHGAAECVDACRFLGGVLVRALVGRTREDILFPGAGGALDSPAITAIARGDYRVKREEDVQGSGYVVHSLEAALWCFLKTDNYRDAILMAANLGDDADTTAAVCGQVAGAYYGESGIPAHWLERLTMRSEIARLADQLRLAGAGSHQA